MRVTRCALAIMVLEAVLLSATPTFAQIQPIISFSPTNPEIGETVLFTINGVPADIDKASWSMGATGCDGADPTPECFPSLWNDCKSHAFKYASQGTRTVSLSVEVGGNVFTAPAVTVTTSSTGSCASISFSPTDPEIGTKVVFSIEGVTGIIETATWAMGGSGCGGLSATQTCPPEPPWSGGECRIYPFTYDSGGPKSVSVTFDLEGGGTDSAGPVTVDVAYSGFCPGVLIFLDGFESGDTSAWFSTEPPPCVHDPCETGLALDPNCDPCVAQICAIDDFCCTGLWDRSCVDQVASVCGQICHTCDHFFCDPGSALDPQCHPCVEQICAVDDFCCTTLWDRDCVDQVPSVCGLTCN